MKAIIILITSLFIIHTSNAGEFAVSPLIIDIDGPKNKRIPFEFTIKAKKGGDVSLKVYDLKQIETGHMGFVEGDAKDKQSKANWIRLSEDTFSIKSDEYVLAEGDIKIPSRAKGQHLAAIMVEEIKESSEKNGIDITVRYAVVLKIDTTNGKVKKFRTKTEFESLSFKKIDQGWEFEGFFINQSKVEGKLSSEVQIRNDDRKLVGKLSMKTLSAWQRSEGESMVYPDSKVRIFGVLEDDLAEGKYQIRVKNRFNDRSQPIFKDDITLDSKSLDQAPADGLTGS